MFLAIKKILEARFRAGWIAAQTGVPFGFEATESLFDGNSGAAITADRDNLDAFVQISMQGTVPALSTLGSRKIIRRLGLATVCLFTRHGSGAFLAQQLADVVAGIFEDYDTTRDGVRVIVRQTSTQVAPADDRFYRLNVRVEFKAEEPTG